MKMGSLSRTALFFCLMGIAFAASAQNSEITIGTAAGGIGADVDVPVTFGANNHDIANWDLNIGYDTNELTLRAGSGNAGACDFVNFGPAVAGRQVTCSEPSAGVLRVLIDPPPVFPIPLLPTGELISVRFTVAATATVSATTPVVFDSLAAGNDVGDNVAPANFTATDGGVDVLDVAPALTLAPTSLTFTEQNGGTSAPQQVVATNTGNLDGLIIQTFTFAGTGFSQNNDCPVAPLGLAQGASCTFNITFSPDAVGDFSTTFDVTSNGGPGQVTIDATATAGPAPVLSLAPAIFFFGNVLTGVDTPQATFTVINTGATGSNLSVDTIGGLTPPLTVGGSCVAGTTELAAGEFCTIEVTFTPVADGFVSQTLAVEGTDVNNGGSQSVSSTVEGTGVTRSIFSSDPAPGNINLGFAGGDGIIDLDLLVSNGGNGELTVDCDFTVNDGGVFTTDPAPLTLAVPADGSAPVTVSCRLPDLDTYSATLSCTTNDPDNATVEYDFTCSGLEPLAVPTMSNWSIALFALMMLLVGGFSIRFFRT